MEERKGRSEVEASRVDRCCSTASCQRWEYVPRSCSVQVNCILEKKSCCCWDLIPKWNNVLICFFSFLQTSQVLSIWGRVSRCDPAPKRTLISVNVCLFRIVHLTLTQTNSCKQKISSYIKGTSNSISHFPLLLYWSCDYLIYRTYYTVFRAVCVTLIFFWESATKC